MKDYIAQLGFDEIKEIIASYARTPMGKEKTLAMEMCATPEESLRKMAAIDALLRLGGNVGEVYDPLPILAKPISALSGIEIVGIASFLSTVQELKGRLANIEDELLTVVFEDVDDFSGLIEYIQYRFLPDGSVRDDATPNLQTIRYRQASLKRELMLRLQRIISEHSDWLQDTIITERSGRMVLVVKASCKRFIPGIVHDVSSTHRSVFLEPQEVVEIGNSLVESEKEEEAEIERIKRDCTERIFSVREGILKAREVVGIVDMLYAGGKFTEEFSCTVPKFVEGRLVIKDAYHPVLIRAKGRENVVPLSLTMDESVRILLVSGPNAGGKTVLLKTVGVVVMLAMCGFPVPAGEGTELPWFNRVLVDIGDEQSIDEGLSSFTSHLVNIKGILNEASDKTLVLLDELGSGTSPEEGVALAFSVLNYLKDKGCYVIATTHFSHLKHLIASCEGMENAGMEFDLKTGMPTYRVIVGVPGTSQGIATARRVGLPLEIISSAKEMVGERFVAVEDLIVELEVIKKEVEEQKREIQDRMSKLQKKEEELSQRLAGLRQEKRAVLREAKEKARALIEDARRLVEQVVKEIKESQASSRSIRLARERIDTFAGRLGEEDEGKQVEVSVGDWVKLKGTTTEGEVLEVKKGVVTVLVGGVRMKVGVSQLEKVGGVVKGEVKITASTDGAQPVLDIRGKRWNEAEALIDRFIDRAVLDNVESVVIIHGKGEGILRKRTREFLSSDSRVGSFKPGDVGKGGDGITVVYIA